MGRWVFGAVIVVIGISLLLNNLGYTDVNVGSIIKTYWPLILVYWGLKALRRGFRGGAPPLCEAFIGALSLIVGLAFLGRNLGWIQPDIAILWRVSWPLVLIVLGLSILRGPMTSGAGNWAFMSGIEVGKNPWDARSGSYFAVMGGFDLDLTRARLPEGETVLDLTAVMGGIDVKVPSDLPLSCEGWALLGGVNFLGEEAGGIAATKRVIHMPEPPPSRSLRITSRVIMGGVTVKRIG